MAPSARPAAGGGRHVDVAPERLAGWLDRFRDRHGLATVEADPVAVTVRGDDGSVAECAVPFPPLVVDGEAAYGGLVAHALTPRRTGVVLVRRGGFAVAVVDGSAVVASKVGSRHVQGRSAAGGWSQQRFARRREGQARVAFEAAAEATSAVVLAHVATLEALVTGGDRSAVDTVLSDPRLERLRALPRGRHLDVAEPRRAVLDGAVVAMRAVRIRVEDVDLDARDD